jgi:hypothetical protein
MTTRPVTTARRRERELSRPPLVALVGAGIGALFFVVPLAGLVWRAPWSSSWHVLSSHEARAALFLSLETSIAATFLAVVFGVVTSKNPPTPSGEPDGSLPPRVTLVAHAYGADRAGPYGGGRLGVPSYELVRSSPCSQPD